MATPFSSAFSTDSLSSLGQLGGGPLPSGTWGAGAGAPGSQGGVPPSLDSLWSAWAPPGTSKPPDAGPPAPGVARLGEPEQQRRPQGMLGSTDSLGSLLGRGDSQRPMTGDGMLRQYSNSLIGGGVRPQQQGPTSFDGGIKLGAGLEQHGINGTWAAPKPANQAAYGSIDGLPVASAGYINPPVSNGLRPYDMPSANGGIKPPTMGGMGVPTGMGGQQQFGQQMGQHMARPGSATSSRSASSAYAQLGNGLPNGGLPGQQPGAGELDPVLMQQLQGLNLKGDPYGAARRVPPPPTAGAFPPQARPQPDGIAALLQARQSAGGLPGGLPANQAHLLRQQSAQQAAAGRNVNDILRNMGAGGAAGIAPGVNGVAGAQGNLNALHIAALQQAAAARAAQQQQVAAQRQQAAFNPNLHVAGLGGGINPGDMKFATQAALIAEASRLAAARQQQQQAAAISTNLAIHQAAGLLNKPRVPARPPAVRPGPPAARGGYAGGMPTVDGPPAIADNHTARGVLTELGQTLAQLNITVESAVNAGLLGGLSAADVKVLAEAHAAETRRLGLMSQLEQLQAQQQQHQAAAAQQQAAHQAQQQHQQQQQAALAQAQAQAAHQAQQQQQQQAALVQAQLNLSRPGSGMQNAGALNGLQQQQQQQQQQQAQQQQLQQQASLSSRSSTPFGASPPGQVQQPQLQQQQQQALFPEAFQLGSLTNSPRTSAPMPASVAAALGAAGADGFSFFGLPPSKPSSPTEQAQAPAGGEAAAAGGAAPTSGAEQPAFDASAYAFFGSVDASDEDALPLELEDGGPLGGAERSGADATQVEPTHA